MSPPYLAPDYIRRIIPYPPGHPVDVLQKELGVDRFVQLASNENTSGPSPLAAAAIRDAACGVNFYPDGGGYHLRGKIAQRLGVAREQIVLGNGSGELVELLCRGFVADGQRVVMSELAFVQYRLSALASNAEIVAVPPLAGSRRDDAEALGRAGRGARLVFIANPNNPTGTFVTRRELDAYFQAVDDGVLTVIDQAYQEYVDHPDYPDAMEDLAAGRNVIVLHTFSKLYGLAGLRIGYGVGSADVLAQLESARLPFNTNTLGQVAALAALDDGDHLAAVRNRNLEELPRLAAELERRGLPVTPSIANFLLVDFQRPADEVARELLSRGIIVRGMRGYGLPHSVRMTVGTREENDLLLAALDRLGLSP